MWLLQVEYRLKRARDAMPNIETIDFSKRSAEEQIREKLPYGEQRICTNEGTGWIGSNVMLYML